MKSIFENVSFLNEKLLINDDDIYYNKDKFDSGEINLCFVIGHSGSGKTTMGRDLAGDNIEVIGLDDVIWNFTYREWELKKYGDLMYSFFKKNTKFRFLNYEDFYKDESWKGRSITPKNYDKEIIVAFINYTKDYAKKHKDKKYVLEGIWTFEYLDCEDVKDYAVFIKGTSMLVSKFRRAKRSMNNAHEGEDKIGIFAADFIDRWREYTLDEGKIDKWRRYFSNLDNN